MPILKDDYMDPSNDTQWIIWAIFTATRCIVTALNVISIQAGWTTGLDGYGCYPPMARSEWRKAFDVDEGK